MSFLTLSKSFKGFSKLTWKMLPTKGRTVGPGGKFFGLWDLNRNRRKKTASHSRTNEANMLNGLPVKWLSKDLQLPYVTCREQPIQFFFLFFFALCVFVLKGNVHNSKHTKNKTKLIQQATYLQKDKFQHSLEWTKLKMIRVKRLIDKVNI